MVTLDKVLRGLGWDRLGWVRLVEWLVWLQC
jgi:hypothetical protein